MFAVSMMTIVYLPLRIALPLFSSGDLYPTTMTNTTAAAAAAARGSDESANGANRDANSSGYSGVVSDLHFALDLVLFHVAVPLTLERIDVTRGGLWAVLTWMIGIARALGLEHIILDTSVIEYIAKQARLARARHVYSHPPHPPRAVRAQGRRGRQAGRVGEGGGKRVEEGEGPGEEEGRGGSRGGANINTSSASSSPMPGQRISRHRRPLVMRSLPLHAHAQTHAQARRRIPCFRPLSAVHRDMRSPIAVVPWVADVQPIAWMSAPAMRRLDISEGDAILIHSLTVEGEKGAPGKTRGRTAKEAVGGAARGMAKASVGKCRPSFISRSLNRRVGVAMLDGTLWHPPVPPYAVDVDAGTAVGSAGGSRVGYCEGGNRPVKEQGPQQQRHQQCPQYYPEIRISPLLQETIGRAGGVGKTRIEDGGGGGVHGKTSDGAQRPFGAAVGNAVVSDAFVGVERATNLRWAKRVRIRRIRSNLRSTGSSIGSSTGSIRGGRTNERGLSSDAAAMGGPPLQEELRPFVKWLYAIRRPVQEGEVLVLTRIGRMEADRMEAGALARFVVEDVSAPDSSTVQHHHHQEQQPSSPLVLAVGPETVVECSAFSTQRRGMQTVTFWGNTTKWGRKVRQTGRGQRRGRGGGRGQEGGAPPPSREEALAAEAALAAEKEKDGEAAWARRRRESEAASAGGGWGALSAADMVETAAVRVKVMEATARRGTYL